MLSLAHARRYLPHELITRQKTVELLQSGEDVSIIVRRYHVSRTSLWRWLRRFDGTSESLMDRSHRPKSPHPNAHTPMELKWISDMRRKNPDYSYLEIWIRLKRAKGYSRCPSSLYRVLVKGFAYKKKPLVSYKPQKYDTPESIGEKWQMDTKFVPASCKSSLTPQDKRFF